MSAPPYYPDITKGQMGYPPPYDGMGRPEDAAGAGAPPPGFYQPTQNHNQPIPVPMVATTNRAVTVQNASVGRYNARVTCSNCRNEVQTLIDKKPSIVAWISAGVLVVFGLFCGCCLIPFFVDACMDTHHGCPNCGAHLGTRRAF
ncbi:unnamed protein product [Orchesella dallaii]|uniref:LITAF domain-containing protein n=1 Tax=Orchesella dallaii TaxID=48710 RepID=A0ABP1RYN3_9HEXA